MLYTLFCLFLRTEFNCLNERMRGLSLILPVQPLWQVNAISLLTHLFKHIRLR